MFTCVLIVLLHILHCCAACSFLPRATQIIGYARTALTAEALHERLRQYLKGEEEEIARFLKLCFYVQGEVSAQCTEAVGVLYRVPWKERNAAAAVDAGGCSYASTCMSTLVQSTVY